jgi:cytochrome c oxidase subunit 1
MVLSLVATGFIGFGCGSTTCSRPTCRSSAELLHRRQHHDRAAHGVQIFCWIATLWGARPRLAVPLLWVSGFVAVFVIGGLTRVMLAASPWTSRCTTPSSWWPTSTTSSSAAPSSLAGRAPLLVPEVHGTDAGERLGRIAFWLTFVGFNVAFFPMHLLGFRGMPRRVWTYGVDRDWGGLNLLSSRVPVVLVAGLVVYAANLLRSLRRGAPSGWNPWGASTLEWAVPSPPPVYNFEHIPVVDGSQPLWRRGRRAAGGVRPAGTGAPRDPGDASHRRHPWTTGSTSPVHSLAPRPGLAVGVAFICGIFTAWAIPAAMVLSTVALVGWFWPRGSQPPRGSEDARDEARERRR